MKFNFRKSKLTLLVFFLSTNIPIIQESKAKQVRLYFVMVSRPLIHDVSLNMRLKHSPHGNIVPRLCHNQSQLCVECCCYMINVKWNKESLTLLFVAGSILLPAFTDCSCDCVVCPLLVLPALWKNHGSSIRLSASIDHVCSAHTHTFYSEFF